MKLVGIHTEQFDGVYSGTRLTAEVLLESRGERRQFWIAVPAQYVDFINTSGDPWLVLMAAYAMLLGEDVEIDAGVDSVLVRNTRVLISVWEQWYPQLRSPELRLETIVENQARGGTASAAFFTGGVDSFFTFLRNYPGRLDRAAGGLCELDFLVHLINLNSRDVSGISLDAAMHGERVAIESAYCDRIEAEFKVPVIKLANNFMSFDDEFFDWHVPLGLGPVLGAHANALSHGFARVLIAGTYAIPQLMPSGSHPIVDPLFSTSRMQVVHDGATFNRLEKTEYIVRHDQVLKYLNVCAHPIERNDGVVNCSRCGKCTRAMVSLDVLNKRNSEAPTFDWTKYDPSNLLNHFVRPDVRLLPELGAFARQHGREDVARMTERALQKSRPFRGLAVVEQFVRRRFPDFARRHRMGLLNVKRMVYRTLGFQ